MKLNNFNSVYSTASVIYGVSVDPTNFEDVALFGWELINNRHTRLYKYVGDTIDGRLKLPCNLTNIESVTIPILDAEMFTNKTDFPQVYNQYVERYIEAWKWDTAPLYQSGKLIKYREEGDEIVFDRDYHNVSILYHGIIVDDEGLPLLSDKEVRAIAAYIVYSDTYKKSLALRDSTLFQFAQAAKADWLKACTAARISDTFSQNDMDAILDAKTSFNRKSFGRSFKPVV